MTHFYSQNNPYKHDHMVEGVVFDLDYTLYPPSQSLAECKIESAVVVAKSLSLGVSDDRLRDMVYESREKYRGSLTIFAEEHGADIKQLWIKHFDEMIKQTRENGFFNAAGELQTGLSKLRLNNVRGAIGTHSHHNWADHVLNELDMSDMFPTAYRVTKRQVGNIGKNQGPAMCDACLDALGALKTEDPASRGARYAVVEDTMENLKSFKERGLMTIFIRRESSHLLDDDIADYVDVVVEESDMAIEAILDSNMQHSGVRHDLSADF